MYSNVLICFNVAFLNFKYYFRRRKKRHPPKNCSLTYNSCTGDYQKTLLLMFHLQFRGFQEALTKLYAYPYLILFAFNYTQFQHLCIKSNNKWHRDKTYIQNLFQQQHEGRKSIKKKSFQCFFVMRRNLHKTSLIDGHFSSTKHILTSAQCNLPIHQLTNTSSSNLRKIIKQHPLSWMKATGHEIKHNTLGTYFNYIRLNMLGN